MCIITTLFIRLDKAEFNKYASALDMICGTASIFSLAAISVERMFAVKYPTRHLHISSKFVYTSIIITWALGFMLGTISLNLPETGEQSLDTHSTTAFFIIEFVLPLIIIIVSYIVLFFAAFNLSKADNQSKSISREINIAKTISVIISLFIICWAPFFALNLLVAYCQTCMNSDTHIVIDVVKALHYSNSMMNFFVYAVRSPAFRAAFKSLLCRCNSIKMKLGLGAITLSSNYKRTSTNNNVTKVRNSRARNLRKGMKRKKNEKPVLQLLSVV